MFLAELLFALAMAILFTLIFALGFKRPGPWAAWWTFLVVVFLAAWAGSLWLSPAGPAFIEIYWLPILIIAFIVALLLAAVTPPPKAPSNVETISQVHKEETATETAFDIFFWILLISLLILILLGYFTPAEDVVVT